MRSKSTSKENKKNIKIVKPTLSPSECDIYCNVIIKSKSFKIYCGEGKQKLSWLSDTILFLYDKNYGFYTGTYF
jgi:hypothetical protein